MMAEWLKCDQCAAQAMWEAKKDTMSLYFCGHHKNAQGESLVDWAHEMVQLLNYEKEQQLETAE
jgi:hypothetical protein